MSQEGYSDNLNCNYSSFATGHAGNWRWKVKSCVLHYEIRYLTQCWTLHI